MNKEMVQGIAIGCAIFFGVLALSMVKREATPAATAERAATCFATMRHYRAVETGMSEEAIAKIVGCRGEEISALANGASTIRSVMWRGSRNVSHLLVTFQDGAATVKSQFGLD